MDNITVSFLLRDHQLIEVIPGGLELNLYAESEDTFYPDNFNVTVHFIKDENGIFTNALIHEHGKDYIFRRTR